MINVPKLKSIMALKEINQRQLAQAIDKPPSYISRIFKIKKCDLLTAKKIISVLEIDNPAEIFFAE
jgi:hypothetical protein